MSGDLQQGDWIKFRSSGFVNEGKVTEVREDSYRIEVPNGPTNIYVDLAKDERVQKIDAPSGQ